MEIWKDILGYEGLYQVSSIGNIRSLNYNKTGEGKVLKSNTRQDNYTRVVLCSNGVVKSFYVHRLVGLAFLEKKDGSVFINHKNYIRSDNRVENLEWCTHKENIQHSRKRIYEKRAEESIENNKYYLAVGENHGRAKLKEKDILLIRNDNRLLKEIAKDYGVSFNLISKIRNRKLWLCVK